MRLLLSQGIFYKYEILMTGQFLAQFRNVGVILIDGNRVRLDVGKRHRLLVDAIGYVLDK